MHMQLQFLWNDSFDRILNLRNILPPFPAISKPGYVNRHYFDFNTLPKRQAKARVLSLLDLWQQILTSRHNPWPHVPASEKMVVLSACVQHRYDFDSMMMTIDAAAAFRRTRVLKFCCYFGARYLSIGRGRRPEVGKGQQKPPFMDACILARESGGLTVLVCSKTLSGIVEIGNFGNLFDFLHLVEV